MEKINQPDMLEKMYAHFLSVIKIKEEDLNPIEVIERKRTFMGGAAGMYALLVFNAAGEKDLEKLGKEILAYWEQEAQLDLALSKMDKNDLPN